MLKLAKHQSRSRFLSDYEIGLFLQALSQTGTKLADPLRLILYTGVRRADVFELPWLELDELHKDIWVIPRARTKNGMDHLLPLPSEMVKMLKATPRRAGQRLVWPSDAEGDRPMSGFSKTVAALHREMVKLAAIDGRTVDPWSIHDLRRTVASGGIITPIASADNRRRSKRELT